MVIVADDDGRENEGDLIMAVEKVTVDGPHRRERALPAGQTNEARAFLAPSTVSTKHGDCAGRIRSTPRRIDRIRHAQDLAHGSRIGGGR